MTFPALRGTCAASALCPSFGVCNGGVPDTSNVLDVFVDSDGSFDSEGRDVGIGVAEEILSVNGFADELVFEANGSNSEINAGSGRVIDFGVSSCLIWSGGVVDLLPLSCRWLCIELSVRSAVSFATVPVSVSRLAIVAFERPP